MLAPQCSMERSGQSPGKSWHDACWGELPYSLTDLYSFIFMSLLLTCSISVISLSLAFLLPPQP